MELIVYPEDVDEKYGEIWYNKIKFEHFKPEVQQAIKLVGSATYWIGGGYNRVYPPRTETSSGREETNDGTETNRVS